MESIITENGKDNQSSDYIVNTTSLPFGEADYRNKAIDCVTIIKEPREQPETAAKDRDEEIQNYSQDNDTNEEHRYVVAHYPHKVFDFIGP